MSARCPRRIPLIVLSHRRRQYLPKTLRNLRSYFAGVDRPIVVDDSGSATHHRMLDAEGIQFSAVNPERNAGYLKAMKRVWEVAGEECDRRGVDYVALWEEDFLLTKPVHAADVTCVMDKRPELAQLNFPRQPVYRIERTMGYMESHNARGYDLHRASVNTFPIVTRRRPFTTNPSIVSLDAILSCEWPTREEADAVEGGAEPAMSLVMESQGWGFGWWGPWNSRFTHHVGHARKSGTGY